MTVVNLNPTAGKEPSHLALLYMKKLKEFTTNGNHPLARATFPEMDLSEFNGSAESHINLVITDTSDPEVVHCSARKHFDGKKPKFTFNNLLNIKSRFSYTECLILVTYYSWWTRPVFKKVLLGRIASDDPAIKCILGETNGYLIFPYQFEALAAMLLEIPYPQAVELRRNFNKQRMNLDEGFNVSNVKVFRGILKKHNMTSNVFYPDHRHAKVLYEYLNL